MPTAPEMPTAPPAPPTAPPAPPTDPARAIRRAEAVLAEASVWLDRVRGVDEWSPAALQDLGLRLWDSGLLDRLADALEQPGLPAGHVRRLESVSAALLKFSAADGDFQGADVAAVKFRLPLPAASADQR